VGPRLRPPLRQDGTTILFGLPGVQVRDVARDKALGRVVHVVTERAVSLEVAHRS
jgi:hypothetical protein